MPNLNETLEEMLARHRALDNLTERDGFSIGDVVQLNSGGAVMTVTGFSERSVYCSLSTIAGYHTVSVPPQALCIINKNLRPEAN